MTRMSNAEKEFRAKYPYANVRPSGRRYRPFEVYAGDYLCADGATRKEAFTLALAYERDGLITPEPTEQATEEVA